MGTYNPNNVNVIINYSKGTHYITGFADSDITSARNSDAITTHIGMKGDTSHSVNLDNSGKITFSLKHDSPSNAVLSYLNNNIEEFQCQIVDGNDDGKAKSGGSGCLIMKPADLKRGKEIKDQEWTIAVPNLSLNYE